MKRVKRTFAGLTAVLGILSAALLSQKPTSPARTHGPDGFRKNLFQGVLPVAHAQQSVGPIGPVPASGGGTTFTGGPITSTTTFAPDVPLVFGVAGNTTSSAFEFDTTNTPDALILGLDQTSRNFCIMDRGDMAAGLCAGASTNPNLSLYSADGLSNMAFFHDGTNGIISSTAGRINIGLTGAGTLRAGLTNFNGAFTFDSGAFNLNVWNGGQLVWVSAGSTDTGNVGTPDSGFARSSAGIIRTTNGTTGLGYFLTGQSTLANTTTAAPAVALSGTVYTNTGDADGSQVTLPNDPTIGTVFTVVATAAQDITIAPSAGETVMFGNTVCGTSYIVGGAATGIGDSATVMAATGGSGAVWITTASAGTPVCTP